MKEGRKEREEGRKRKRRKRKHVQLHKKIHFGGSIYGFTFLSRGYFITGTKAKTWLSFDLAVSILRKLF